MGSLHYRYQPTTAPPQISSRRLTPNKLLIWHQMLRVKPLKIIHNGMLPKISQILEVKISSAIEQH